MCSVRQTGRSRPKDGPHNLQRAPIAADKASRVWAQVDGVLYTEPIPFRPRNRGRLLGKCQFMKNSELLYKIGFLGAPNSLHDGQFTVPVDWSAENIVRLKTLGFNTVQLNVAWGSRPGDEPLNIEDIVELAPDQQAAYPQPVPLRCNPSPERRAARRQAMHDRIALCRRAGLRTIFHFGAPYNAHARYGDNPPNCISDPKVAQRYVLLLEAFARQFPGVDDILVYTYDQDAWLCSEFGQCPRCQGVPLHERLVPFLEQLRAAWQRLSPEGRLWWEPWELSAGQVLACVHRLNSPAFGLALHSNIAEVQATLVADRWLKNTCQLACERSIPVIVEHFLGATSEELESFTHLAHPLVTLRALQTIASIPGVVGIKEYFGLVLDGEDPNLRMTALFFANPRIAETEALSLLAEPYGPAARYVIDFWRQTSTGMELFPWDTSWFIREIGRSDPAHALSTAMLRGQQAHTPSWESTRRAVFMKTDNAQPDPWMLEDVQLRCQQAGDRWAAALHMGRQALHLIPPDLSEHFEKTLADLAGLRCRTVAYAYHLRETSLAAILRSQQTQAQPYPPRVIGELQQVLAADLDNCRQEKDWPEMRHAIDLLQHDLDAFLRSCFRDGPDERSKGSFSVTSR